MFCDSNIGKGADMDTSVENSGGRVIYKLHEEVKLLGIDGTISKNSYKIATEKSDRNGIVSLVDTMGKEVKVNFRRILPATTTAQACILEVGDKYKVVCPQCKYQDLVKHTDSTHTCSECGHAAECYWLTSKPISVATPQAIKKEKPMKAVVEQKPLDFQSIVSIEGIKLYTKKNVTFDHPKVDVKAHVIICTLTEPPRKLCFNTYNGTLGKKQASESQTGLPLNELMNGGENSKFFSVKDLAAEEKRLTRNGYEEVLP